MLDSQLVFQEVWQGVLDQWTPLYEGRQGTKADWLRFFLNNDPQVSQLEEAYLRGDVAVGEVLVALGKAEEADHRKQ